MKIDPVADFDTNLFSMSPQLSGFVCVVFGYKRLIRTVFNYHWERHFPALIQTFQLLQSRESNYLIILAYIHIIFVFMCLGVKQEQWRNRHDVTSCRHHPLSRQPFRRHNVASDSPWGRRRCRLSRWISVWYLPRGGACEHGLAVSWDGFTPVSPPPGVTSFWQLQTVFCSLAISRPGGLTCTWWGCYGLCF